MPLDKFPDRRRKVGAVEPDPTPTEFSQGDRQALFDLAAEVHEIREMVRDLIETLE